MVEVVVIKGATEDVALLVVITLCVLGKEMDARRVDEER